MARIVRWCDLALRVDEIAGVGFSLREVVDGADRLALPRLGRLLWDLCCAADATVHGIEDVSASDVELLLQTDREDVDLLLLEIDRRLGTTTPSVPRRWRLPVCFESGPDWHFVVAHTGLDREGAIEILLAGTYRLAMYGFLPGFAYLLDLDERVKCPRRPTPRAHTERGSVALGGDYLGVYGVASPAGWQVIGHTPVHTFSWSEFPPMPIAVGDELVLERIDRARFDALEGTLIQRVDPADGDTP